MYFTWRKVQVNFLLPVSTKMLQDLSTRLKPISHLHHGMATRIRFDYFKSVS